MLASMVMHGGPAQPLLEGGLEMMPRNEPVAFTSHAPAREILSGHAPKMTRKARRAAETKARQDAKNQRPKGVTLYSWIEL